MLIPIMMKANLKPMTSMIWIKSIPFACIVLWSNMLCASSAKLDSMGRKDRFLGFTTGISFEQGFSTFKEDNSNRELFTKPSLGGGIVVAYNPWRFAGVQSGIGIGQRGTGVITPDFEIGLGDPDSTYRLRVRITTLQVPLNLCWRINTLHKNMKLSGAVGYVWVYNLRSLEIFYSLEDGFHQETDVKSQYKNSWSEWNLSLGFDFDANKAAVFRLHYFVNSSFSSVYAAGSADSGKSFIQGIRFQWYL